ncbi:MAG: hypothetical protein ABIH85_01145 [Candidatus Omnitrophota bacterium]|nr:hypothetical protein [Candidatus Omnitrophota bacterium]
MVKESERSIMRIAGYNKSGKTIFTKTFLPKSAKCDSIIDVYFIALGLSVFSSQ